jgi:hypothetical protein
MTTEPFEPVADLATTSATGYHRQVDATSAYSAAGARVMVNVTGIGPARQAGGATAGSITIVP